MKSLRLLVSVLALGILSSCGGEAVEETASAAADAKTWCECTKLGTPDCNQKIEKIVQALKKDSKLMDAFIAEAVKVCPDAKDVIEMLKTN